MNDTKNFEFKQTNDALAELSELLVKLNESATEKKKQLVAQDTTQKAECFEIEQRLELLRASSQNIINNIDNVITKLDKVLVNDGTSNNNN